MRETIFAILLSFVCLTFWMWQVDDNVVGLANERLKNALNYAAHDASLQVNKSILRNGSIVFEETRAEEVFRKTLADNLFLNSDLSPKADTLLKAKVSVIYTDYIDDSDKILFPYFYENDLYGIHHWINGPAVIYAIEVPRPKAFNLNPSYNIIKWSVFEYPVPD